HQHARARHRVAEPLRRLDAVEHRHADVHQHDVGLELERELDRLGAVRRAADDLDAVVRVQDRLERLEEEALVIGDEDTHWRGQQSGDSSNSGPRSYKSLLVARSYAATVDESARERVQKLLLTGD